MDIKNKMQRSNNMSKIRSKNTSIEIKIRKILYKAGFRYRLHYSKVCGSPDLYFAKYKSAVFINGCFWHRHKNCKYAYTPKTNIEFWNSKFYKNVERDNKVISELNRNGIKTIIIWECTVKRIKDKDDEDNFLKEFYKSLESEEMYIEI